MPHGRLSEWIVRPPLLSYSHVSRLCLLLILIPTDRAAIVPPELAAASGLIESQVQVSDRYGGGFPANVEGLHHLHCLNLLRQALYFNFDYYHDLGEGAFSNKDEILRFHVSKSPHFSVA